MRPARRRLAPMWVAATTSATVGWTGAGAGAGEAGAAAGPSMAGATGGGERRRPGGGGSFLSRERGGGVRVGGRFPSQPLLLQVAN